ncbi:MAG: iron chelate uptake ABC transporter family permease subunit, partial [Thermoguttaceae bacterium]|nr:iron chelate uptake ABC transporter family permease subunit [Thermoguttaceae bacterium]
MRFPSASRPLGDLDAASKIFWIERLPKTLLAALAGAGLALAGLAMQTLFRNPLATPYTLGVASGASFGATLTLVSSGAIAAMGIPSLILGTPLSVWGAALGA